MAEVELTPVTPGDLFDRDVDPPRLGVLPSSRRGVGHPLAPYQRMLANPFLAIGVFLGGIVLLRHSLAWRSLVLFWGAVALLAVSPMLFQYHCLDCGKTGHVASAWRHACPPVERRLLSGQVRAYRGLRPADQTKLWLSLFLVAFFYVVLATAK